jgi:hypothetical protein
MEPVDSLEQRVLNALASKPAGSFDALQVAKAVIGPQGTQAQVNPTLYKLHKQRKIERTDREGARPLWKINLSLPEAETADALDAEAAAALDAKIIATLERGPAEGLYALQIAKVAIGLKAKATEVNSALYRLFEEGKVAKELSEGGSRPLWRSTRIASGQ